MLLAAKWMCLFGEGIVKKEYKKELTKSEEVMLTLRDHLNGLPGDQFPFSFLFLPDQQNV
jgi:hypothetical protein